MMLPLAETETAGRTEFEVLVGGEVCAWNYPTTLLFEGCGFRVRIQSYIYAGKVLKC
jgi:hypothetical protein